MSDLATRLVFAFEKMETKSAGVMRRAGYLILEEFGIDVRRLKHEAAQQQAVEDRERLERKLNEEQRLIEQRDAIPELQAQVHGGPAGKVRELLLQEKKLDEIVQAVGCSRSYVTAVRNLDRARAADRKLSDKARKAAKKAAQERLQRTLLRESSTAPTKERRRQLGPGEQFIETKLSGDQKIYRTDWAIDSIRELLTGPEYDAAIRVFDAYWGMNVEALGNPGPATDKLALTPQQQYWGRVWAGIWPKVPGGLRRIVLNFVVGKPWTGEEKTMTFVEFGKQYGRIEGPQQARGAAHGAIKATCTVLAYLSKEFDGEVKAEKRIAARAMAQHADIRSWIIAAADAQENPEKIETTPEEIAAVGLMCKRHPDVKAWAIWSTVRNGIKRVLQEREKAAAERAAREGVRQLVAA